MRLYRADWQDQLAYALGLGDFSEAQLSETAREQVEIDREDFHATIFNLIEKHQRLNTAQVCRLVNDLGKDDFKRCYLGQEFAGTTRPHCRGKCETSYFSVRTALFDMAQEGKVKRLKIRMRDKGGIGKDSFNIWISPTEQKIEAFLK